MASGATRVFARGDAGVAIRGVMICSGVVFIGEGADGRRRAGCNVGVRPTDDDGRPVYADSEPTGLAPPAAAPEWSSYRIGEDKDSARC
ncbi:hypothetical protein GCM10009557_46690 [Virgisporangium ochraceum]|uniref:Uncharacterized protein n=1 Tax=Virgisporangium ochraceum TaxID=65505 RepID=A0A8J4A5M3_9ACTN|nr:hypothetical protein Voc01_104580 [Virgisporangium ochraceum]